MKSIENDSVPLPQVTTKSIDALRAYALAQKAQARYEYAEALQLFERATTLDPQFALAWLGQVRVHYSQENAPRAEAPLRRAQELRAHLPPREALYLDAWVSEFDAPAKTTGKWIELARLYPDYLPGRANAATWLYLENRFEDALLHAQAAAIPQYQLAGRSYDSIGRARLGLEQYADAEAAFNRSFASTGGSARRLVATAAARRDFAAAQKYEQKLEADNPFAYLERASLAVDRGRWREAHELADKGLALARQKGGVGSRYMRLPVAVSLWLSGDRDGARRNAKAALDTALAALVQGAGADAEEDAALALSAALVMQRLDRDVTNEVLGALGKRAALMEVPQLAELAAVLRAEQARRAGKPGQSIDLLMPFLTGNERYQTHVVLMESYAALAKYEQALEHARWLQKRRGLAYVELQCGHCLQALNVADSNLAIRREAELLRAMGNARESSRKLEEFGRWWPAESLPDYLRTRQAAVRAFKSGVV